MKNFLIAHWILASLAALLVIGLFWYFFGRGKPAYQFVAVTRGSIVETVSVTGNTAPVESASLSFGTGGTISRVYAKVGDMVSAGVVLATLNTNDLSAQLAGAQATADAEVAALHKLQAGATREAIGLSQAQLGVSKQSLANAYANVRTTLADAYADANDAVRNQIASFFTNAETSNPKLTLIISDFAAQNLILQERVQATIELNAWQASLTDMPSDPERLDQALARAATSLSSIRDLLMTAVTVSSQAIGLTTAAESAYRTEATAGLTEVNTALAAVNTAQQSIASGKASVAQLEAQLRVTTAPPTVQDLEAQTARVEQAQANVASVRARIQNAQIIAPLSGMVTQCDAKIGQTAQLGAPLISLISQNAYEVEANIPETDIGKIAVGNTVAMTLDAFPGETFAGTVSYIDPAETITQGVVDYKIKVFFDAADPRMKSGLTANLDIQTRRKDDVLILPQYAILENDDGIFVETLDGANAVVDVPVTLGMQDQDGNVEIVSGVTEGQQVLNIGLKR